MKSPFHNGDNGVFKPALDDNCPLFGMVCPVENTVYIQYIRGGVIGSQFSVIRI